MIELIKTVNGIQRLQSLRIKPVVVKNKLRSVVRTASPRKTEHRDEWCVRPRSDCCALAGPPRGAIGRALIFLWLLSLRHGKESNGPARPERSKIILFSITSKAIVRLVAQGSQIKIFLEIKVNFSRLKS